MNGWTLIRVLHLVAMAFFVGGQLVLAAAVVPVVRRHGTPEAMREDRWSDGTLHVKLAHIVLVLVLVGLHAVVPRRRALSAAVLLASLAVVWLGVTLAHG